MWERLPPAYERAPLGSRRNAPRSRTAASRLGRILGSALPKKQELLGQPLPKPGALRLFRTPSYLLVQSHPDLIRYFLSF
jgi:hypothetical protein